MAIIVPGGASELSSLKPGTISMLCDLENWSNRMGMDFRITSAYRSPARQEELRAAWDRGDRQGLVARPAVNSAHTRGEAVDLVPANEKANLELLGMYALMRGYRWGGSFSKSDPVHFDISNTTPGLDGD